MFGENIAYYRKPKHLTQEGLALKANVSRTHISHIEVEHVLKVPSLDRSIVYFVSEPYQLFVERETRITRGAVVVQTTAPVLHAFYEE